jgi:hypothetical protein
MPTPFTHLEIAQRLLRDDEVPAPVRALLDRESGAFLLGSIAADARVGAGLPRSATHFYSYAEAITEHPWHVMVRAHPALLDPRDDAQRAFVAGYVAHLSVDEWWSLHMVRPHFAEREWGHDNNRAWRFYMLHIILIYMDERDLGHLEPWQAESLNRAEPSDWLPFASDADLRDWRDLIDAQIVPGGESRTLEIFGGRINKAPEEMRAFLDSPSQMQSGLWDHIPMPLLAEVEAGMYDHARQQMLTYLQESVRQPDQC